MMFPVQQYFTNHRNPLPRVFPWTFRNPSKIKLAPQEENPREIATTPSQVTMASLEVSPTPVTTTNGVTNGALHDTPVEPTISFDPEIFRSYLLALLPPLLGATPPELEYLFDDEFEERVHKFALEGGGTVYVVKKREEVEGQSPLVHSSLLYGMLTYIRGCASIILVLPHITFDISFISCHNSRHHQTWSDTRPNLPTCHSTTYHQSLWW